MLDSRVTCTVLLRNSITNWQNALLLISSSSWNISCILIIRHFIVMFWIFFGDYKRPLISPWWFDGKQVSCKFDNSIKKKQTKTTEHSKIFQCNITASADFSDISLLYLYLISVLLCNVLYFIKRWFTVTNFTVISKPRYFEFFFPFPLGLGNRGVRL